MTVRMSKLQKQASAAFDAAVAETTVREPQFQDTDKVLRVILAELAVYTKRTRGRAYAPRYFSTLRLLQTLARHGFAEELGPGRGFRPTALLTTFTFSDAEIRMAEDSLEGQGYY